MRVGISPLLAVFLAEIRPLLRATHLLTGDRDWYVASRNKLLYPAAVVAGRAPRIVSSPVATHFYSTLPQIECQNEPESYSVFSGSVRAGEVVELAGVSSFLGAAAARHSFSALETS